MNLSDQGLKKTALLLGPAPSLEEDLKKIDINDYQIVCGLNECFHKMMQEIFNLHKVKITHYYFSESRYRNTRHQVDSVISPRKILYAPRISMIPETSQEIEICDNKIVEMVAKIGEYTETEWPTTGIIALGHLLLYEKVDFVKICGFSFGEGQLHLYDHGIWDRIHHDVNKEKKIYNHFNKIGKCST